ncbi:MAG: DNA helicase RecQ [Microscillaceae bacterium]|nr:DNA helicase RecQ [Microscillaceae bacterium]
MSTISEAKANLKKYFGYDSFRPQQEEIIQEVLSKQDVLVLMPTGGGKSICYQIPAVSLPGTCIVISPLIALMKDQVEALRANGISAAFLNSSLISAEQQKVEQDALSGKLKLLYVSPEKLLTRDFYNLMLSLEINLIAIDEAHCISAWGHDFRPEYTQLRFLKNKFPAVPIIALTATADKVTRKDILTQLQLTDPKVFIASFDRPNLSLNVLPAQNRFKVIMELIQKRPNDSGIIYCLSRKSTEEIAEKLRFSGVNAAHYHALLSAEQRAQTQEDFIQDRVPIICATIAFGMGIDKSNVRWVIHYNLPKNIEGYYQEIGRAGRDGLKSNTLLFYSIRDVALLRSFIEESGQKEVQLAKLERMQEYAEAHTCRRKILLSYFGEHLTEDCGNCDVCKNPPTNFDGTVFTQQALSALARLKEKVSLGTLIDVLRGSSKQEVIEKGYHQIKTYGIGRQISALHWQQYLLQMLHQGFMEIDYEHEQQLRITPLGKEVLFDKRQVKLIKPDEIEKRIRENIEKSQEKPKTQVFKEELFEELRKIRLDIARDGNIPPYVVFSDATLQEMSEKRPTIEEEIKKISGVGEKKYQLYGQIFIDAIIDFIKKKNEEGERIKGSTYIITYDYYKSGLSVDEIAQKREISSATVLSHLTYLYDLGQEVDLESMISIQEKEIIYQAFDTVGFGKAMKPFFEYLQEKIPYDKIRIASSIYKKEKNIKFENN